MVVIGFSKLTKRPGWRQLGICWYCSLQVFHLFLICFTSHVLLNFLWCLSFFSINTSSFTQTTSWIFKYYCSLNKYVNTTALPTDCKKKLSIAPMQWNEIQKMFVCVEVTWIDWSLRSIKCMSYSYIVSSISFHLSYRLFSAMIVAMSCRSGCFWSYLLFYNYW